MVPGRTYLFAPRGNRAIHIDSIETTPTGYRYHNYRTVKYCGSGPYDYFHIGPRVMQVSVTYDTLIQAYHWQNIAGDSLTWLLNTQPDESWRMATYRDSLWLTVKHDSTTWDSVLGAQDSVRHYHVNIRDEVDSLVSDSLNGLPLRLSQSHGFLKGFSYDDFPQVGETFELEGVSNPDLGRQLLTEWDFYDMPVGGEIHYEEVLEWDGAVPYSGLKEYDHWMRWRILERQETPDMRRLTIRRTQAGHDYHWNVEEDSDGIPRWFHGIDTLYSYENDTIEIVIADSTVNRLLPYEPNESDYGYPDHFFRVNGNFYAYDPYLNSDDRLGISDWFSDVYEAHDTCWSDPVDSYHRKFAIKGLGDFFYGAGGMVSSQHLMPIYYRFPDDSAGTPIDFEALKQDWLTSIAEPVQAGIRLYPNPMRDRLYFNGGLPTNEPVTLRLYDLQGQRIWQATQQGDYWALPTLSPGLYLAELWQGDRLLARQKVRRE